MHSTTVAIVLALAAALQINAFHVESGTSCSSAGATCSYISNDSSNNGSATTAVNGFCAPDLLCASNGAKCSNDDECFNYCGSDGTCGGEGAGCNTQATFSPGQTGIACGDGFSCSSTAGAVGSCQVGSATPATTPKANAVDSAAAAGASQQTRRNKRRLSPEYHAHQVKARDLRKIA